MSANNTQSAAGRPEDRKALEDLVLDNAELELLETLLDRFNIFEAIGAVRQELRHSDFLAFLLDPQQAHGLGDAFAKKLLQKVLSSQAPSPLPITPIDLDVWSLDQLLVLREWRDIDILLVDEDKTHQLVVIIENKIDSTEGTGQLERYYERVQRDYPGWKTLGIFLTPEGDAPSNENYLPVGYGLICELIESISASKASSLGEEVKILMDHYTRMLRRHIVSESEIVELCRRIYQKHRRALDLIYEHRPDQQAVIHDALQGLISQTSELVLDHSSKGKIRFTTREWKDAPTLLVAEGWTASKRILLFEFHNSPNSLRLKLVIGPGPKETRQRLFDIAHKNKPPFKPEKSLYKYWNTIFNRQFLSKRSYENDDEDEIQEGIENNWTRFLDHDLPKIREAIKG